MNRRHAFGFSSLVLSVALSATSAHAGHKKTHDAADEPASADTSSEAGNADEKASSGDESKSDADESKSDADESKSDADESKAKESEVADAEAGNSPVELPNETYRFIGLRYRGIVVPKFMETLFAAGGRTVYVNGIGPEFGIRKNGFEYSLSPWLALYNMDDTAFKGKNDPELAWELISTNIKILYLTSDFLWTHEFTPEFGLNYGIGAGLGIVFGDLYRTQSTPNGQTDPNKYAKCAGPSMTDPYCDNHNNHYNGYTEPSWANGGSKPIIFPWLTVQTGFRFKPSKSFAARLDLGFGTSGFFFGLGADYGL
jgi:hypothetical protein